jgi:hypothetical protein
MMVALGMHCQIPAEMLPLVMRPKCQECEGSSELEKQTFPLPGKPFMFLTDNVRTYMLLIAHYRFYCSLTAGNLA